MVPHRSIHIGDQYETDVVGARAVGMDAVLLRRPSLMKDPLPEEAADCVVLSTLTEVLEIIEV
ncbi:MAG: HAD hydrolase-like protein [Actinomycetota bacterium]